MPNTYVDYTATASQTDFAFSFPYLEDAHVVVEINGTSSSAFSLVITPSTKIVLNSGATAGQKVRVRRDSNASIAFVDFVNGSVLTEKNLDDSYLHNLYLNEEIGEMNERSLQKEVGGTNWDARNLKLINLADPTIAQDASTKNYTDTNDALKVAKAGDSMTGSLVMGTNKITGLGNPTNAQDASTKTYTDTNDALKVNKSGDTMSGSLALGANKVTGVGDPTNSQDASTKNYTDTNDALKVTKSGDTMSGNLALGANKVTGVGDPTNVQDAATKNYVDTTVSNTVSGSSTNSVKTTFTGAGSAAFTFGAGISLDGDTMYEVAIDGVLQEPTVAYAIDANANTITFTSTPPTGSNIVVVQRGYAIPVTTGTVSTAQINNAAITTTKLVDDAITTAKINNTAITTAKIDNTAITTAKIANNAVTDTQLNSAKLNGIAVGATANDTDANLKNRANHTGSQLAATISDFDTEVSNNADVAANTAARSASSTPFPSNNIWYGPNGITDIADSRKSNLILTSASTGATLQGEFDDAAGGGANSNIIIGKTAGRALQSSGTAYIQNNIAIGDRALDDIFHNTIPADNQVIGTIAIGANSMCGLTGINSIGIGHNAGTVSNSALNPHDNSIQIGADSIATADNQVVLGNSSTTSLRCNTQSISSLSDERTKENVKDSNLGLEFINELKTKTFNKKNPADWDKEILEERYKDKDSKEYSRPSDNPVTYTGLIAQEVKGVLDKLNISEWDGWDEEPNGVQRLGYGALVLPLIKAVQELSKQVEELKSKI